MNGTNELLRAILKVDGEERARTQATEKYRQKATSERAAKAKEIEDEAMAQMHAEVEQFSKEEQARADRELAAQEKRKQQVLAGLDQQLAKNRDAWVETIMARVLGGGQ